MNLAGKIVVVTGAGSGIGRELVFALLRREARVAAVDINEATLRETAELADRADAVETYVVNVAVRSAVEALAPAVVHRFGAVDVLINNAGIIQPFVRFNDLDYAAMERVFGVNWYGTLYMTKTFLPLLLARPAAHVVNVSSMGGFLPVPGQTVYGASKAAVKLFTEGLHAEMAGTHVGITLVLPGAVGTNIAANSGVPLPAVDDRRAASVYPADKAARDILDGIEDNRYRVLIGRDARLMDALYRLHPRRAAAFIADQMKDLLPGP